MAVVAPPVDPLRALLQSKANRKGDEKEARVGGPDVHVAAASALLESPLGPSTEPFAAASSSAAPSPPRLPQRDPLSEAPAPAPLAAEVSNIDEVVGSSAAASAETDTELPRCRDILSKSGQLPLDPLNMLRQERSMEARCEGHDMPAVTDYGHDGDVSAALRRTEPRQQAQAKPRTSVEDFVRFAGASGGGVPGGGYGYPGERAAEEDPGGHWACELCGSPTPPVLGRLARPLQIGRGARHHCRPCGKTVCGGCSLVVADERTCKECHARDSSSFQASFSSSSQRLGAAGGCPEGHREKFIFLVRHAESNWNVALKKDPSLLLTVAWSKDHPLSDTGVQQTEVLRRKIATGFLGVPTDNLRGSCPERARRYYAEFFVNRDRIYSSPLLRALQTAHLVFSPENNWRCIKLLRDAREHFTYVTERDCIGTDVGAKLVERAAGFIPSRAPGLGRRVDYGECEEIWWQDTPETGRDLDARHLRLWSRLLDDDIKRSCVVVTHSNLIRALMLRFAASPPNDADPAAERAAATLRQAKAVKLHNCGVLGVHCVRLEGARQTWVVRDAMLMFGSDFAK